MSYILQRIQSNLDLVTNLVIPKTVTKSRVVTKFMVDTWWVSNIFKSKQDFKTDLFKNHHLSQCFSRTNLLLQIRQSNDSILSWTWVHNFYVQRSILCLSNESFHKQIFHLKSCNLMASFFHDHEPISFLAKEVFYQQIFHHKLCNLMALTWVYHFYV